MTTTTRLVAASLLLAASFVPAVTGRANARVRPNGCGRLVYVTYPEGRAALRSVRADGSGRRTLLAVPRRRPVLHPTWSPTARLIAFVRNNHDRDNDVARDELWVMRFDGSRARRLSQAEVPGSILTISWAPDGRRIVFSRVESNGHSIHVIDLDGNESDLAEGIDPAWSPDGAWIAFSTSTSLFRDDSGNIERVRPDGSERQVLTDAEDATDTLPRWEPDSDGLAFKRYPHGQTSEDGPYSDIWDLDIASGEERQLTQQQDDFNGAGDPQYSSNGRRITFVDQADDFAAVQLMDADGSDESVVQSPATEPDWGASSSRLAFIQYERIRIYSTRTDKKRTVIRNGGGAVYNLDWAPC